MNADTAVPCWPSTTWPGPRYTSYPTVPYWERHADANAVARARRLQRCARQRHGRRAIYVHVPFCRLAVHFLRLQYAHHAHARHRPALRRGGAGGVRHVSRAAGRGRPLVGELHLGGGTPTFLNPDELEPLLAGLLANSRLRDRRGAVGRGRSARDHCRTAGAAGGDTASGASASACRTSIRAFRRSSIANRARSRCALSPRRARALGFNSVNFDLIYGLPLQTLSSIEQTMDAVCRLRPDRIALYGYAHVPWIKPGQRRFTEADLPEGDAKRALVRTQSRAPRSGGLSRNRSRSFRARDRQSLARPRAGTLHRNFMGYTDAFTRPLLGLGVSAIGDAGDAFAQNEKDLSSITSASRRRAAAAAWPPAGRGGQRAAATYPATDDPHAHDWWSRRHTLSR